LYKTANRKLKTKNEKQCGRLHKTVAYREREREREREKWVKDEGCCCLVPANARKFPKRVLTHLGAEVQSVYSIICTKMNVHFA